MSYCADIVVPCDPSCGLTHTDFHGIPARCIMTGCFAATADASLAAGIEVASDANGYAHIALVYVEVCEVCDACGGSGRVQRRRRGRPVPYAFDDCKACKRVGAWPIKVVTVVNPASEL